VRVVDTLIDALQGVPVTTIQFYTLGPSRLKPWWHKGSSGRSVRSRP
jgi:hypothetical protein